VTPEALGLLTARALRVREHIVRMSGGGGCFMGASLSCADLLVYLYTSVLRVSPAAVSDPNRDYLFLSKGHDVPALYGTLAELGFIERQRLANHLKPDDSIYWHPNRAVAGVEFHSGSLGHLLAVAVGVALDIRLREDTNRVFIIVGDGELNEGSIWESALVAAAQKLDNLILVVDRNQFQANLPTEQLVPLEPIDEKFKAFGWTAWRTDGHDFDALERAFRRVRFERGRPSAIVADTVRGRGLPSIERKADRWFVRASLEEVEQFMEELHGGAAATLASEVRIVR
jgi:transketolase